MNFGEKVFRGEIEGNAGNSGDMGKTMGKKSFHGEIEGNVGKSGGKEGNVGKSGECR